MSTLLQKKFSDYEAIFDKIFPRMNMMCATEHELIEVIDKCIYERKSYEELYPCVDDDIIY